MDLVLLAAEEDFARLRSALEAEARVEQEKDRAHRAPLKRELDSCRRLVNEVVWKRAELSTLNSQPCTSLSFNTPPSKAPWRNSIAPVKPVCDKLPPMGLKEQAPLITLARKLGQPAHVSGLAIRVSRASGARDCLPEWLLKVAVERGAKHYQRDFDPSLPPDSPALSDEEIGIALCLGQHPYNLDNLRAAAQLLSSPRVDAAKLCRLAVQERCEAVLGHIAAVAERFAPALEPWAYLRQHLPPGPMARTDALPHWTRLVSHSGVTARGGPPRTDWLCRHE